MNFSEIDQAVHEIEGGFDQGLLRSEQDVTETDLDYPNLDMEGIKVPTSWPSDAEEWIEPLVAASYSNDVSVLKNFLGQFSSLDERQKIVHSFMLFNARDEYGSNLLHVAVEFGNWEFIDALIALEHFAVVEMDGVKSFQDVEVVNTAILLACCLYKSGVEQQRFGSLRYEWDALSYCKNLTIYMREEAFTLPPFSSDLADFESFIGNPPTTFQIADAPLSILPWAFASPNIPLLEKLKTERADEHDLLEKVFQRCRDQSPTVPVVLADIVHGLLQYLRFQMLHSRSFPYYYTTLHIATLTQSEEMLSFLLGKYDDLVDYSCKAWNFLDLYSMTPLHYAVLMRSEALVQKLLGSISYEGHVNARDWCLRTPLHLACSGTPGDGPSLDLIKILVGNRNIDLYAKDCCDFTALKWAVYVGAPSEIAEFLAQTYDGVTDFEGEKVQSRKGLLRLTSARQMLLRKTALLRKNTRLKATWKDCNPYEGGIWHLHLFASIEQLLYLNHKDQKFDFDKSAVDLWTLCTFSIASDAQKTRSSHVRVELPTRAYSGKAIERRGVQHAISKIPDTCTCRRTCLGRDVCLLFHLYQKIDREHWEKLSDEGWGGVKKNPHKIIDGDNLTKVYFIY